MLNKFNKIKKASSLIEVIIVLAIVSFTIIASMALVARTRLEIKNNEISDNANGVMLKALEALKTPTKVVILGNPSFGGAGPYYFSLKETTDAAGASTYILNHKTTGFTPLPKTTDSFVFDTVCKSDNAFYLTDGQNFKYCQMVEISPIFRAGVTRELYKVSTTIIYQTSNQAKAETLTTYRYEGFKKIQPN